MTSLSGGCLCGQARWRAAAAPVNVRFCHCGLCRRASGGLAFARAVFRTESFERTGRTRTHPSSARLLRHYCAECGAYLYGEPVDRPDFIGVSLSSLDDPEALKPDMHIWVSAKPSWLVIDDGLPQHAEGAPW